MSASRLLAPEAPELTTTERDAMLASVLWFRARRAAGLLPGYDGMHVAVLGEAIIDADRNEDELIRRLEARAGDWPPNRIVLQYVPGPADPDW